MSFLPYPIFFLCILSINFKLGETGETPETDAQSARIFAVPPASDTRDHVGQLRCPKRRRGEHGALVFDAEPRIDFLLPFSTIGYGVPPRTALAIANRVILGWEALAWSEHCHTRRAEAFNAYRSEAILPTEPRVRLAEQRI
jgi:hypothetical protein